MSPSLRRSAAGLLAGAALALAPPAWADPQPGAPGATAPTDQARLDAAHRFAEGEKAFQAEDFRHAAALFEAAYHLAPHPNALWNAARAWQRSGDLARAATLYARYLVEAPPDAPGRPSAITAMKDLSAKTARVEITAPGLTGLRVDDTPIEGAVVYVLPGSHVFSAHGDTGDTRMSKQADPGATLTLTLTLTPALAPAPAPALVPAPALAPAPGPAPPPSPSPGWSPWVIVAGGAITLAGVTATIVSGIDTTTFKSNHYDPDFAAHNVHAVAQDLAGGYDRERRTNILLAATVGVGALTGVAALWLVDWHGGGKSSVQVGGGPGSLLVRGRF